MRIHHETTYDKRVIISVLFERESPDADTPTIEVVFLVHFPESFELDSDSKVLFHLSTTRTDTREKINLTEEELKAVMYGAGEHAAGLTSDW